MNSYDRAELTRPGHVPSLITDRYGDPTGSCTCGWRYPGLSMGGTATAIRRHIEAVDRDTGATR